MKKFRFLSIFATIGLAACALAGDFDDLMLSKSPVRAFVYSDFNDASKFGSQFDPAPLVYDDGDVSAAHPGNATMGGAGLATQVVRLLPYNYQFDAGSVEARLIVRLASITDSRGAQHSAKLWVGDDSYSAGSGSNGFVIERVSAGMTNLAYYRVQPVNGGVPATPVLVADHSGDDISTKTDDDGFVNIRVQMSSAKATVYFESSGGSSIVASVSTPVTYPSNFMPTFDVSPITVDGFAAEPAASIDYYAARIFVTARTF